MQDINKRQSLDFVLVILSSVGVVVFGLYMALKRPHVTVRYDCSISEINPDYPVAVKEACRKLRAENILQSPK